MFKQWVKRHTRRKGQVRVIKYERYKPGIRKRLFSIAVIIIGAAAVITAIIIIMK